MACYRLEFDASSEPQLIEEENGSFETPMANFPWPEQPLRQNVVRGPDCTTDEAA